MNCSRSNEPNFAAELYKTVIRNPRGLEGEFVETISNEPKS